MCPSPSESGIGAPLLTPAAARDIPFTGTRPDTVVVAWNEVALQAVRDTHPGPPMVARMLSVVHTCMYDAWAAYANTAAATRTGTYLRRPPVERTDANKTRAISYAAYRALRELFPAAAQLAAFDALMAQLGFDPADLSSDLATATGIGNVAAGAVLAVRRGDGSNQAGDLHAGPYSDYTGYLPVNTPETVTNIGRWQPLRIPDGHGGTIEQRFIAPHWGLVTPFALADDAFAGVHPPATPGTHAFRHQAEEVLRYSAELTDREKVIAEYWADGPSSELPPGHWCLFAQYVSRRDSHSLDQDIRMFFALTSAILDASIACWGVKRRYDYVRPVTAIHELFRGQQVRAWAGPGNGTQMIDGATWRPYQAATVVTPPFAEFYSGHSTFSAAGAQVLKRFTGRDAFGMSVTVPAGTSRVEPGLVPATDLTLHWPTFSDAADEAGISRRYGGIHFVDGDMAGRKAGRRIGRDAWERAETYFSGQGGP